MRSKNLITLLLMGLVAAALVAPVGTAVAKKAKGPVAVGEDVTGDWGAEVDPTLGPVGDALGMDLVGASIGMADKETVNFIITVNSLPPTGGTPEIARYSWDFTVDGKQLELDGKFTNYTRGACDPTSGQCPPPRDPGMQPFMVRGNCAPAPGTNVTLCEEIGIVHAVFDAAEATITIPVPLELLGGKAGSKIVGIAGTFGGTISAAHAAFFTSGNGPMDQMITTGTFVVPKK